MYFCFHRIKCPCFKMLTADWVGATCICGFCLLLEQKHDGCFQASKSYSKDKMHSVGVKSHSSCHCVFEAFQWTVKSAVKNCLTWLSLSFRVCICNSSLVILIVSASKITINKRSKSSRLTLTVLRRKMI